MYEVDVLAEAGTIDGYAKGGRHALLAEFCYR